MVSAVPYREFALFGFDGAGELAVKEPVLGPWMEVLGTRVGLSSPDARKIFG